MYQLAEFNVGRLLAPLDDPAMKEFVENLDAFLPTIKVRPNKLISCNMELLLLFLKVYNYNTNGNRVSFKQIIKTKKIIFGSHSFAHWSHKFLVSSCP